MSVVKALAPSPSEKDDAGWTDYEGAAKVLAAEHGAHLARVAAYVAQLPIEPLV